MRNSWCRITGTLLGGLLLVALANAQTSQPPANPSAPAPSAPAQSAPSQDSGQGQMSSESISAAEQTKLAQEVMHQLLMLPYYGVFDSLAFRLQGRTVILEGQVLRSSLKPDAEHAVKKIEGVDKVINNIQVLPPGAIDMQIRQAVREAIYGYGPLFKYSNLPIPPIRIIVRNAHVTLEGQVDNETDKGLCTMRANQVSSVMSVTNNLRVVPQNSNKKSKSGDQQESSSR